MILDAGLLIAVTFGVQMVKNKYPNFLFYPKGAVLFLPPEDLPEIKPKKKKDHSNEVSVIKIQYQNVKDHPFANQLSRVLMTAASLVIFILLRMCIGLWFNYESLITFYLLTIIFIYTLKLGIQTFLLTNYDRKICLLIALGINAFFFFLFFALENYQGVYDQTIKQVIHDYVRHLQIIFNKKLTFVTYQSALCIVFSINFFVIIAVIPSVIKFGSWYAKTLKQVYFEDDEQERAPLPIRVDGVKGDEREHAANLKRQSKIIIYKLNIYLMSMLMLIVFSHRYWLTLISDPLLDSLRALSLATCCYSICSTMPSAIEFNGSFAYKYVIQFFEEENKEKRAELKKRVVTYIYYIWYHYFQFVIRLLIPIFIFLLVLTWKYLLFDHQIVRQPIEQRTLNLDIECPISTNQLQTLQNLYRCPVNTTLPDGVEPSFFLSGSMDKIPSHLPHPHIQQNIQKYTILTREVVLELTELLLWYSSVSIYLLTVTYILFLRKTVFDL